MEDFAWRYISTTLPFETKPRKTITAAICIIVAFAIADAGDVFAVPPIFGDPQFVVGFEPRDVEIADLDRDGMPDAVVPNFGDGSVSVMLGTGGGGFVEHVVLAVDGGPQAVVAIADFNGDGNADFAVATRGASDSSISPLDTFQGFWPLNATTRGRKRDFR